MKQRENESTSPAVIMYQNWEELLFLHWSFDPEVVQQTLPDGLTVDTFEGRAWIGVVPFFMSGVRPRFLPGMPGVSSFQELNLRTYVVDEQGRSGVWFYSLDTSHRLPVWIARTFFHLNYVHARMFAKRSSGGAVDYSSQRNSQDSVQRFQWKREGVTRVAEPGTLEHFLVERYRLYSYNAKCGRLYTGTLSHAPYQIQEVSLEGYSQRLFALNGFATPAGAPESVLATTGVQVRIHPLRKVYSAARQQRFDTG
ncbi:MAG: YqjF family protein [Opitutaceae bacterium]